MNIITSNFTVAEFCGQFDNKDLVVNKDYQRSDEVWPESARSFLIETIILGFPIPKLIIRQSTDMKNLKTFKEIVDGQQRTKAIIDFFHGKFALSNSVDTADLVGRTMHTLNDEHKERFVTYMVTADVLVGASQDEVIDVFRRMNSYTVPLNPEEQRHAKFQGPFKWFMLETCRTCERAFTEMGVFREKNFVRMQDTKLLTEVCHAMLNGIQTTNKGHLDKTYNKFNKEFADVAIFKNDLVSSVEYLIGIEIVAKSALAKPYNFYALMLATIQIRNPRPTLMESPGEKYKFGSNQAVTLGLSRLSEALEDPDHAPDEYAGFVAAASERTNVKAQRITRFRWFIQALSGELG